MKIRRKKPRRKSEEEIKMAYLIKKKSGRTDGRIWKTKEAATSQVKGIIKNNTLKQRQQTGFVGLKVVKAKINDRERKELKRAKEFIRD